MGVVGARLETDWLPQFERLDAPFEVSEGVSIAPGTYHFQRGRVQADSRPDRPLRFGAGFTGGGFYDGVLREWSGYVRWSLRAGRLQLDTKGLYVDRRLPEGDFIEQLWQEKAVFAFSPDLVFSLYTQYDSVSQNLGTNARLRYTIRPGADLYVVWNRGWVHPPDATSGTQLGLLDDQAVVKLRWAWRPLHDRADKRCCRIGCSVRTPRWTERSRGTFHPLRSRHSQLAENMVPGVGVEPTWPEGQGILRLREEGSGQRT